MSPPNRSRLGIRFRIFAAVLLGLSLGAACSPEPPPATIEPAPTTTILTVHIASELGLLRPILAGCAAAIPGGGLLVFEADSPALPAGPGEVTLWFGEPPAGDFLAALLGFDEIVVIAPAERHRGSLTADEVRALFGREVASPATADLWIPQIGLAARSVLDQFTEGAAYPPEAFLAPTAAAMVEAVGGSEDAIGVLPAAWLTDDLDDLFTLGELPVLALTDGAPQGMLRELIGCLQVNPVYGD